MGSGNYSLFICDFGTKHPYEYQVLKCSTRMSIGIEHSSQLPNHVARNISRKTIDTVTLGASKYVYFHLYSIPLNLMEYFFKILPYVHEVEWY